MATTTVKCFECKKYFEKRNADYNRTERLGKRHFCGSSCCVKNTHKNLPKDFWKNRITNINFKQFAGNRQDDYSPFRTYLNKGRSSNQKHKMNLSVEFLKTLWDKQNGICPYTGIKMILPKNTLDNTKIRSLKKASLDRINSKIGYTEDNVEFVCMAINGAKNSFTKEEMKEFINSIALSVTHS